MSTLSEITRESITAYHARDAISHSKLEVFRDPDRGPARFKGKFIDRTIPHDPPTAAMDFGQALDSLVLEKKRTFKPHPATYPGTDKKKQPVDKPWTLAANYCEEWEAAEHAKGFIILSPDPTDIESAPNVDACAFAVEQNPVAKALLSRGEAQLSLRYNFGPFWFQVRPDWRNTAGADVPGFGHIPHYLCDLKSATDWDQFQANRRRHGYDRQAVEYAEIDRMVMSDTTGVPLEQVPQVPFFFIVALKTAPVQCVVCQLEKRDWQDAYQQVIGDLQRLKDCYRSGIWPGVPTGISTLPSLNWQRERATAEGTYQAEAMFVPDGQKEAA